MYDKLKAERTSQAAKWDEGLQTKNQRLIADSDCSSETLQIRKKQANIFKY